MQTRTRGYLLGAAAALILTWSGLQFWLAHRSVTSINAHMAAGFRRLAALSAEHGLTKPIAVPQEPTAAWVQAGVQSVVELALLALLATALVRGGLRWWTLIVAAFPAALVVGGFRDGTPIGLGWQQPTNAYQTWLAAGTAVDTLTVLAVVVAIVVALPTCGLVVSVRATLVRTAAAVIVLVGWWLIRNPSPAPEDKVWIAQAVVWVLAVALVATSSLSPVLRTGVLLLLPLFSFTVVNDLLAYGHHRLDGMRYLSHLLVVVGVTAYVVGVPLLQRRVRHRTTAVVT